MSVLALLNTRAGRPSEPRPALIDARAISRSFDRRRVLEDVSIRVEPGEIHALLGPNGAGKTTLLRILAGLVSRSSGELLVAGADPSRADRAFRGRIGVVPASDRSFYLRISGLENLVFFGRLHGLRGRAARSRALELLELVGLRDAARLRVGAYSQGMQKRLAVARALLSDPSVLLVDEATHDLDPLGAQAVRDLIAASASGGAAVVWATQRLDEIVAFADGVTVLRDGACRFSGSVHDLAAVAASRRYVLRLGRVAGGPAPLEVLSSAIGATGVIEPAEGSADGLFVLSVADGVALGDALGRLAAADIELLSCERERSEVEEAFLRLTATAG